MNNEQYKSQLCKTIYDSDSSLVKIHTLWNLDKRK